MRTRKREAKTPRDEYRPPGAVPPQPGGPKLTPEEWRAMVDKLLERAPAEVRRKVLQRRRQREAAAAKEGEEKAQAPTVETPAQAVEAAKRIVKPMPRLPEADQLEISAEERRSR